jgi:3-hydroxyacyl-CoA dehydrogenase
VARPEDVDGMFKVNWGVSAGPFQMMDLVGLDVVLDIENHYAQEFPHLPKNVRELLQAYVDAGKLGGQVQGRGVRRRRVILRCSGSGGQCRGGGLLFCW